MPLLTNVKLVWFVRRRRLSFSPTVITCRIFIRSEHAVFLSISRPRPIYSFLYTISSHAVVMKPRIGYFSVTESVKVCSVVGYVYQTEADLC